MKERPIECSGCNRDVCIQYSEIEGGHEMRVYMCDQCPILQLKLHGEGSLHESSLDKVGVCCSTCGTTLQAVRAERKVGCAECYAVFEEAVRAELGATRYHVGRTTLEPSVKSRVSELNLELKEALKQENFEHAAYLRDKIKELMHDE